MSTRILALRILEQKTTRNSIIKVICYVAHVRPLMQSINGSKKNFFGNLFWRWIDADFNMRTYSYTRAHINVNPPHTWIAYQEYGAEDPDAQALKEQQQKYQQQQ